MKMFRDYIKNEMERKTIYIITAVLCIVLSGNIYNSVQSYKYRRLCDQYREQLVATEEANRNLTDKLGRVTEVVERLHETTERNVTDARDIIETVELLRAQIQEMENICYGYDTLDSYYNYWDNAFSISQ